MSFKLTDEQELLIEHNTRLYGKMTTESKILTVMYLTKEQWQKHEDTVMETRKGLNKLWMAFKFKYFIRAWAYQAGWLILMKKSAKGDMKLLHHEMGHAICDKGHNWLPGIMHPIRWLRWFW